MKATRVQRNDAYALLRNPVDSIGRPWNRGELSRHYIHQVIVELLIRFKGRVHDIPASVLRAIIKERTGREYSLSTIYNAQEDLNRAKLVTFVTPPAEFDSEEGRCYQPPRVWLAAGNLAAAILGRVRDWFAGRRREAGEWRRKQRARAKLRQMERESKLFFSSRNGAQQSRPGTQVRTRIKEIPPGPGGCTPLQCACPPGEPCQVFS